MIISAYKTRKIPYCVNNDLIVLSARMKAEPDALVTPTDILPGVRWISGSYIIILFL